MKKKLLLLFTISVNLCLSQSKEADEKKWGIRFEGFVKADFWYDSRAIKGSREDYFLAFPDSIKNNREGKDLNSADNLHASIAASRLTGKINAPDVLGAKAGGLLEADFTGASNLGLNEFRIRHAYARLNWTKTELLLGQTWHPMFTPDVFPDVLSLNTGAPFQPFIRNPQVQLQYLLPINFKITIAAILQRDNASAGPNGISPEYLRKAVLPNLHLQFSYKTDHQLAGIGLDYKRIIPTLKTDSGYVCSNYVESFALVSWYKFSGNSFIMRAKAIFGQNLTEHLLLGGYAVEKYDTLRGEASYTPYNHLFLWVNPVYGKKIQLGLFAGYAKNFGTSNNSVNKYYTLWGNDVQIDQLLRISSGVSFITEKLKISLETEYTRAWYGKADKGDKNQVKNTRQVANTRILAGVCFYF